MDSGCISYSSQVSFSYPGNELSDDEFSLSFSSSRRPSTDIEDGAAAITAVTCITSTALPGNELTDDEFKSLFSVSREVSHIPVPPPPPPIPGHSIPNLPAGIIPTPPTPPPIQFTFSHQHRARRDACAVCYTDANPMTAVFTSCCASYICLNCFQDSLNSSDFSDLCPNPCCPLVLTEKVQVSLTPCIVCYSEINEAKNRRMCCLQAVCKTCLQEIARTNIEDEGKIHILCPNPDCEGGVMTREEILSLVQDDTKQRYEQLRMLESENSNRKTCPNCCLITEHKLPSKFRRYREEKVRITCSQCKHVWCFKCHAPWHSNLTCRQFQRGDKQFKKWTKSKSNAGAANCQKCPLCRVYIQKSSGCNHMTCNRCDTEFCYKCGGLYNGFPGLGDHYSKISIFGCRELYKPEQPFQRKTMRWGYVGAKLAMLTGYPVLFVAGVAVVVVVGVVALPVYGGYRYYKYRKNTQRQNR